MLRQASARYQWFLERGAGKVDVHLAAGRAVGSVGGQEPGRLDGFAFAAAGRLKVGFGTVADVAAVGHLDAAFDLAAGFDEGFVE